ncbi:unnamed protein product [Menidia menidia]|uniref:receptor protein-tyrosine kinase n=1 Tax=Menidia menidia TaxID=238744 RepID=A0A8S4AX03_9TELE|nr:unnamed protein product [Menidia menidia]
MPVAMASTTVCMRVELYGCPWEDGLMSYSAPEGQLMVLPGYSSVSLMDSTYDGVHERRRLTDGVTGQDNFLVTRQHPQFPVRPGYGYLGWRNDSQGTQEHVEMEFPRLSGAWEAEPVVFNTVLDDRNPSARYVTVPLHRRAARSLRCRFHFADVWMMFSEISFQSEKHSASSRFPAHTETFWVHIWAAVPSASAQPDEGSTPVLIGCLVTIILLLVVIIFLILWCQCVCKVLEKAPRRILGEEVTVRLSSCSDTIILQTPPVPPRAGHAPTGPPDGDPHYERVFLLDPQYQNPAVLRSKLPELSQSAEASALLLGNPLYDLLLLTSSCGGGYAEPDVTQCTPHQCFHSSAPHYAETDIVRLQGVTGSNMYAVPALTVDSLTRKDISAAEFPRQQLLFREKLGEGQFGEVHLCEAEGLPGFLGEGSPLPDRDRRSVLVAEIKIMSRLDDPNIIRLLCVCVSSDPLCMVTEYMENGDLNMFLSQREIESTLTHANNIPSVSLPDLLHMAVQISSGMRYLASLNFVHRDLATRNCLVDRRLTIKIADFGMSRNLYSSDYYRIQGRAVLPIRWMAWESILLIFTLCKEQPYSLLTDEQVIQNTGEFFRNQGRQIFLYAPPPRPPPPLRAHDALLEPQHPRQALLRGAAPSPEAPRQPVRPGGPDPGARVRIQRPGPRGLSPEAKIQRPGSRDLDPEA